MKNTKEFAVKLKKQYHDEHTFKAIHSHDFVLFEQSLAFIYDSPSWKKNFHEHHYGSFIGLITQQPSSISMKMLSFFLDKHIYDTDSFASLIYLLAIGGKTPQWPQLFEQFHIRFKDSWTSFSDMKIYEALSFSAFVEAHDFLQQYSFIGKLIHYKPILNNACQAKSYSLIDFLFQESPAKTIERIAQYLNDFSISTIDTAINHYFDIQQVFLIHCSQLDEKQFKKIQHKIHRFMKDNEQFSTKPFIQSLKQERLQQLIILMEKIHIHHHLISSTSTQSGTSKPKL